MTPRRLAAAVAGGRLLLGVVAVVRPELPARFWVGAEDAGRASTRVLGRALGGRDLVLAAGTLCSLRRTTTGSPLAAWVAAGAVADALDASATLACWKALPSPGRLLVCCAAAGATAAGVLAYAQLSNE